jgi:ATP-dependent DNA ligase
MTLRLADLKKKCESLGYSIHSRGLRPAKAEFLAVLRQHYINQDYPTGIPYTEIDPMLCANVNNLLPKAQEQIWKDDNGWIAQEKFDGERAILHLIKDVGTFIHSRVISTKNYRRTEWANQSPFKSYIPTFTAVVDAEAMNGKLFHVFDCIRWQGTDLRKRPLDERLGYLQEFREAASGLQEYLDFPSVCFTNKKQFFESIIQRGKEGIVLKRLDSQYNCSGVRTKNAWLKVKKQIQFDAFVVGFKQGRTTSRYHDRIAYLIFAITTEHGRRIIAKVANMPKAFRRDASIFNPKTKEVELRMDVLNKVATVTGLELSRKAMRIAHPRITRWRGDLRPENCVYKEDDLQTAPLRTVNLL